MKNKKCPNKKSCWGYVNNSCDDCSIGMCINKLHRKIEKLKAENEKLKAENEELTSRLNIILNHDFREVTENE